MSLKIASWNIEKRLSLLDERGRGTPEAILEQISLLDADILVLPEVFEGKSDQGVDARLREHGYNWRDVEYLDKGREEERSFLRILSRLPIVASEIVRLGDIRNTLIVTIRVGRGRKLRVIGMHLDDRSETSRLQQLHDLIPKVNETDVPTIVLGDWNAMHGEDWRARLIHGQFVRRLIRLVPSFVIRDILIRLSDMARGSALRSVEEETTLRDLDVSHHPTTTPKMRGIEWMPSIPLVQIDHIYATPSVTKLTPVVVARDGGSDHRAISCNITI